MSRRDLFDTNLAEWMTFGRVTVIAIACALVGLFAAGVPA